MPGAPLRRQSVTYALFWVVIIFFAYVVTLFAGSFIAAEFGMSSIMARLGLHALLIAVMLVIVIWSPRLIARPRVTLKDIGIDKALRWRDYLWGIAGFVVYMIAVTGVMVLVEKIAWFNIDQPQQLGFDGMSGQTLFAGFVVLAIVTPIVEEMLFRGVLQGKLRAAGIPFLPTALIVGGLFAAAHGQWNVAIDVFCMSLVSSYLREKTGRLWPSILVHIIKNSLAFYITFVIVSGTF